MLGFGKKADGFEWQKYVRTTIKRRREDRRERVLEARDAAIDGVKLAGRAGAAAAVHGAQGLGHTLVRMSEATMAAIQATPAALAKGMRDHVRPALRSAGRRLAPLVQPLVGPLSRPGLPLLLAIVGGLAALSAVMHYRLGRFDRELAIAAAIAVIAFALAAIPVLWGRSGVKLPPWLSQAMKRVSGAIPQPVRANAGYVGVGLVLAMLGWSLLSGAHVALPSLPLVGGKSIEGRAYAVSGDLVRVNNTLVRLAGIEAPLPAQRCKRGRCSEAATDALNRIIRGRMVQCAISGSDEAGRALGNCSAGKDKDDIADRLVREGYAFSSGGLFGYGSAEREAKAQKAGVWLAGEVERPSDVRARIWETARKASPEGCPIKGQVSSERKTYVLPWSSDYDRIRVRPSRGERWFCSEAEAVGAGFKAAQRG